MPDFSEKVSSEPGTYMDTLVKSDHFTRFLTKNTPGTLPVYLTLSVPFENIDPLAVLELNGDSDGPRFFWERPDYEMAIAGGNQVTVIKSTGIDRFKNISKQYNALLGRLKNFSEINHSMAGAHFTGGFSFFDHPLSGTWTPLGNASFILPEWLLIRDGQFSILNVTRKWTRDDSHDDIRLWFSNWIHDFINRLQSNLENSRILNNNIASGREIITKETDESRYRWMANVEHARSAIREKLFKKIVIARQLKLKTEQKISSTKLIHFLRKEYPSCYSFLYQLNGDATFLGSTPEKLLSLQSRYVKTVALAGSIPRGKTATRDAILEKKLLESLKDREEHAYVLDSIREKLRPITNSLEFPSRPFIQKYANVQHLCTPMAATLIRDMNAVDILERLHPTPAVGGYPELDAILQIQNMEQIERGWYAGPIGWFNTNQRAEFSVAIRSGLIRKNHVRFFAGCGIVEDSDPGTEWEETQVKFLPMQKGLEYATE